MVNGWQAQADSAYPPKDREPLSPARAGTGDLSDMDLVQSLGIHPTHPGRREEGDKGQGQSQGQAVLPLKQAEERNVSNCQQGRGAEEASAGTTAPYPDSATESDDLPWYPATEELWAAVQGRTCC